MPTLIIQSNKAKLFSTFLHDHDGENYVLRKHYAIVIARKQIILLNHC